LALICIEVFSSIASAHAGLLDKMGAHSNYNSPKVWQDQLGSYASGGSIYIRTPTSDLQLLSFDMPSIDAGCGGINVNFGGFGYISGDQIQKIIKKDGKTKRLNSVEDSKGSFEFLLFALLYNLRRKANREGSEILFTLGNHEYESFIQPGPSEYYKDFVPIGAKKFFNIHDENIRKRALLPFLMTSPYYILSFTAPKIEIVCIHKLKWQILMLLIISCMELLNNSSYIIV
jgi:hypothetical protein